MIHRTEIKETTRSIQGLTFTAYCPCGWEGLPHGERRDAEDDADEHVRIMV